MSLIAPPGQGQGQGSSGIQKHRACDECRIRKLACTKELEGCSRCARESIPCHYSAQKPMGRPRKRRREEAPDAVTGMTQLLPDFEDPGMQFLLDVDFDLDPTLQAQMDPVDQPWDHQNWGLGDVFSQSAEFDQPFGPVDFDIGLSASQADPGLHSVESISPSNLNLGSSSESGSSSTGSSTTTQNCDCIASLYSALSSMQKLPAEVEAAVREARTAAKVAYEVVNCPQCSIRMVQQQQQQQQHQQGHSSSVQSFQTLMLLATLIPSIVHAYAQMLTVVDAETERAIAERRNIVFKLDGLGGVWGCCADDGDDDEETRADAQRFFGAREMEPALWRLAVRALMKCDVYGTAGCQRPRGGDGGALHLGLKDLVLLMENRARERHAFRDAMVEAGFWKCGLSMHRTGQSPTCQQVISIARSSIEQLHIP